MIFRLCGTAANLFVLCGFSAAAAELAAMASTSAIESAPLSIPAMAGCMGVPSRPIMGGTLASREVRVLSAVLPGPLLVLLELGSDGNWDCSAFASDEACCSLIPGWSLAAAVA